jgi:hypothetical protein
VRGFIHIIRICGEKLSKRPRVKGHNSSKSTNRKILTLGISRHYHLASCQVSSKSVDKCRSSCAFRHTYTQTHRHTDTLLTNQDKHPKEFGSVINLRILCARSEAVHRAFTRLIIHLWNSIDCSINYRSTITNVEHIQIHIPATKWLGTELQLQCKYL